MLSRSLTAFGLALLVAGCSGGFDRQKSMDRASHLYLAAEAEVPDSFRGIQLYGPPPADFIPLNRTDRELGCSYFRRDSVGTLDYTEVCADDGNRIMLIRFYKEFENAHDMDLFFDRTRKLFDGRYGKRIDGKQTPERYTWEFKNRNEWTEVWVKADEDEFFHGRYGRIYRRPLQAEVHDKLALIALEKQSGLTMPDQHSIELKDHVVISYMSRLAKLKKSYRTETRERDFRESLRGL